MIAQRGAPIPLSTTTAKLIMTVTIMYRARRARRAAEAIGCNTCLFLLQDLWAKVVGASAKSRPSQLLHRKQFGTEHDIVAAGTRTQTLSLHCANNENKSCRPFLETFRQCHCRCDAKEESAKECRAVAAVTARVLHGPARSVAGAWVVRRSGRARPSWSR